MQHLNRLQRNTPHINNTIKWPLSHSQELYTVSLVNKKRRNIAQTAQVCAQDSVLEF